MSPLLAIKQQAIVKVFSNLNDTSTGTCLLNNRGDSCSISWANN